MTSASRPNIWVRVDGLAAARRPTTSAVPTRDTADWDDIHLHEQVTRTLVTISRGSEGDVGAAHLLGLWGQGPWVGEPGPGGFRTYEAIRLTTGDYPLYMWWEQVVRWYWRQGDYMATNNAFVAAQVEETLPSTGTLAWVIVHALRAGTLRETMLRFSGALLERRREEYARVLGHRIWLPNSAYELEEHLRVLKRVNAGLHTREWGTMGLWVPGHLDET